MNRLIFFGLAVLGAAMPLVMDSALKGAALLGLAALSSLVLWRASAAARHLLWLVAVVALLMVPLLSILLPGWRVLPQWAVAPVLQIEAPAGDLENWPYKADEAQAAYAFEPPTSAEPSVLSEVTPQLPILPESVPAPRELAPVTSTPPISGSWRTVLPGFWLGGCALLLLRLLGAHWLLRLAARGCTEVPVGSLTETLAYCSRHMGVHRQVRLLLDQKRTIPVVWGVWQPRLMLPAEAVGWDVGQLQSVFLHELAHIRRRDTSVQWITQLACAFHWFNPLVWLAAWRLHVERERACDDMVLASGVKPSAYAGHLLHVATQLSPAPWTAACGLAMARKSSLEGRLLAVLSEKLNRRSVTSTLAGIALIVGAGIAIPVAMLRAADETKPPTPAPDAASKHKDAHTLYEIWQRHARANGDIPGALIGELAAAVKTFIGYNPTWETVPKLNALLPRLDTARDWKPADAIALLDEVAAVQDSPLKTAAEKTASRTIRKGEALSEKFAGVAWGETQPNGLRAAWVLEPGGVEHRFGDALRARLLVHNSGKVTATLQVPTWHQGEVKASDAKGAELEITSTEWTTLARLVPVRLAPGEFIEINTPGVGFGPRAGMGPWAGPRVGSNVLKNAGADLTLTHGLVPLDGSEVGVSEDDPHVVGPGWWLAHIKARLSQELPLPADAAERTRMLDRTVLDLFGTAPTAEETAAFVADKTPDALDALIKRLAAREDVVSFSGKLPTAPVKFRVFAAVPAVDKTPRVVLGPGEYPVGGGKGYSGPATLKIVGRPVGDRRTNDAQILFAAAVGTGKHAPGPHKLEVPDGWGTWAIVCRPSDGFLYLLHKGGVRKIDYSVPGKVTDTSANDLPAEFRDEVKRQFDIHEISAEQQAEVFEKPAPPAATESDSQPNRGAQLLPATEQQLKWGEPQNGLRAALVMHPVPDEPDAEDKNDIFLVVQNVSPAAIRLHASEAAPNPRQLIWREKGKLETVTETAQPIPADSQLQSREVAFFRMLLPSRTRNPGGRSTGSIIAESIRGDTDFDLTGKMEIEKAPAGAWTGKLLSGEIKGGTAIPALPQPSSSPPPAPSKQAANMIKLPDDQYVKSGLPVAEVKDVVWNDPQNGLSLGYRITGDEWRILGKEVKVELWVRNPGEKDVKFQLNMRPDMGLRMKLKDEKGEEKESTFVPNDRPPFGEPRLLPPGHALKVKDFAVSLLWPENDVSGIKGHYFAIDPGAYNFHCELELPGFSATGEGGKQFTPAAGEWTGTLTTRSLNVMVIAPDAPAPKSAEAGPRADDAALKPKHEYAQSLFRKWQASARTDGKIPGALIGHIAREVDGFLKQHPDDDKTPQLAALHLRLDASRDWTQAEVVALLDDITAISTAPVSWADIPMEFSSMRAVKGGEALPIELKSAAWGQPTESGLRAAWLLEPRAEQYPLGSVLKARVLFHNTGKTPVVFKTETWHQADGHTARDAKGAEIKVGGSWFTGITPVATFRLAPGEYCEVKGHGIAIGVGKYEEEHSTGAVGAIIEAKEGDAVALSHSVDTSYGGWTRPGDPKDPMELWKATIAERIANEAPMPRAAADREQLIRRVTRDIFGIAPTAEEIAAFTADETPDALAKLTARLQAKPRVEPFSGKLPTGETKFRVIAADPDAAKAPRTANSPGRYVLGDNAHLLVSQLTEGDKRTNKAVIAFLSSDPKPYEIAQPKPYEIALPDGIGTYGIVWDRGTGALWVMQKDLVRKYEFNNPAQVQEMKIEPGSIINIPPHMHDALKKAFDVAGGPVQQQNSQKPTGVGIQKSPKLPDDAYAKPGFHCQKFREEDAKRPGGELMGDAREPLNSEDSEKEPLILGIRTASDAQWHIGGTAKVGLVVRNRSDSDVKFAYSDLLESGISIVAIDESGKEHRAEVERTWGFVKRQQMLLPRSHVATVREFTIRFDDGKRDAGAAHVAAFHLPPGKYKLRCNWRDAHPQDVHEGEWTGELVSGEHKFTLAAAAEPPASQTPKAGAKLALDTEAQLDWGDAVNGLRGALIIRAPDAVQPQGIYLAVQNVSETPLRFADTIKAEKLRTLYVSASGQILFALSNGEATQTDVVLQPREVAYLSMMLAENSPEKSPATAMIEGIRKDSLQTWRAVLAMEKVPPGAWSGKLTTGETRGAVSDGGPQPKSKEARALFKFWQNSARLNGDIPGGLVRLLHEKVKEFIHNNENDASGGPYAKKMMPLEPRFANGGDWKAADVVVLLDDVATANTIPLETTMDQLARHTLQRGLPLPASLSGADWGEPLPGGLRMAHVLEPRAKEYRVGTEIKARIILHNSGKEPVAFVTTGFQQPGHKARLAGGGELTLDSTFWTTLGRMESYRLDPGDYCEIYTPGLGIGAQNKDRDDWSNVRAGSWIPCAAGNDVVFTPGAAMLFYDGKGEANANWWLEFITERLNREAPVPDDTKEREYLLYRVVRDLFGTAPSTTEGDAFAEDKSPDVLKNLAALLAKHPYGKRSHGLIRAGTTTFRVLPPDADAAKRPRVANNPGWFTLRDDVKFSVTRRPAGEIGVNEASIIYFQQGKDNVIHNVKLPDGYNTWAAAWEPGTTVLWLSQKGLLQKFDFSDPAKVTETRYEGDKTAEAPIPADVREAIRATLDVPDAPKQEYELLKPAVPAPETEKPKGAAVAPPPEDSKHQRPKLPDNAYARTGIPVTALKWQVPPAWGEVKDGLQVGIRVNGEAIIGGKVLVELWITNSGKEDVRFLQCGRNDVGMHVMVKDDAGSEHRAEISSYRGRPVFHGIQLPPGHITKLKEFALHLNPEADAKMEGQMANLTVRPGDYKLHVKWSDSAPLEISSGEVDLKIAANAAERPNGAAVKLTPDALLGFWRGTVNEEKLMLSFHGSPAEKDVQLDIYFGEATIGALARFTIAEDGGSAEVVQHSAGGGMKFGTLRPGDAGTLKLELHNRQRGQTEVTLTRDAEAAATEPRQKEVRVLFEMWKRTANDDGTIPGTFIGALATEVRAYVKANPNLDSAMKLPKLLPRFVTSRDWTQADAIKLLDDVAYYSMAPIAALLPKLAKLPDDSYAKVGVPMQEVEAHMEWSGKEQDGLCVGMRIAEDAELRIGGEMKVELWVCSYGEKDVKFQYCPRRDIGLRVFLKGADGKEHEAEITQFRGKPGFSRALLPAGHVFKVKEFSVVLLPPGRKAAGVEPHFTLAPGDYKFRCEVNLPGTIGVMRGDEQVTPAEGEWTGTLKSGEVDVNLVGADAPAAKPAQVKPAIERATVDVAEDGEISLDREEVTLDELKARAAKNAKKWFTIRAEKDVPYAKVIEVVEALKAAGVTEFSFSEARVGDGKYRVANRQASYKFDDKHGFSICRPSDYPQFFTVSWPAEGARPACWLRTYPNVSGQTQGKWAVVWEPGTNVLWWVDDSDVGKMTLTDPARVIVDREGRTNNFSRDFALPDGVVTEFRRLGFEVGREPVNGRVPIGGNTGGQSIVSAEFGAWSIEGTVTDADGKPLANVPVRVTTNQQLKTETTDAKGNYRAYFSLPLQLLAHWRAVTVEPVLEGFTERDMAKAGEFNVLFRAGEQPQRVRIAGDEDFQPGSIPRFAERDLVPSHPGVSPGSPGRADFVMLKAGEITGEIVTADGMPAPPHFIAAATAEQRPGHSAAIELSDAQGHFRLKGIPTNKPVIFTVNPDGKPGETSKSSEQKFEQTGAQKIRIILPADGSGKGPVKLERLTDGASAVPLPKPTAVSNEPIFLKFAAASDLPEAVKKKYGPTAASAILSVDVRANALKLDASHPNAAKVRELIAILDQRHSPVTTPPFAVLGVKPERTYHFKDKYSAVAYQTEKDVNFVLVHEGFISTGLSESWSETMKRWSIEGNVHLVDRKKTKAAGKNVDKRVVAVKYTSDAPTTLFLDGKAYDLAAPRRATPMGALQMPGRIFILRDEGEPLQTDRTLALRNEKDLVTIGDFAGRDLALALQYADSRRVRAMEGWVLGWDVQDSAQHGDSERAAMLRIFPDGRVLALQGGRELKEFKISPDEVAALLRWLAEEQKVGEWKPEMVKAANGVEFERDPVKNMWDRETDVLFFIRDGKRHGVAVEQGEPGGAVFTPIRERLMEVMKKGAAAKTGAIPVRAQGEWSAEWQALSKIVAESRGLADWKAEDFVAWGPEGDGLRSGMLITKRAKLGETVNPLLVLRNVSDAPKTINVCTSQNVLEPTVHSADGKTFIETRKVWLTGTDALFPVTLEAGEQLEFAAPPVRFGVERDAEGEPKTPDWPVAGVVMGAETVLLKFNLGNVRGPETGEVAIQVAAVAPKTTEAPKEQPKQGTKLQPATEQKLDWSEPANGLRMALTWPPSLGEPAAGQAADFFAAVQNVSDAPVRLVTTAGAPDERWLDMRDDSGTLQRLSSKEPSGLDVTLQPLEVVFLRLLPEGAKAADRLTTGAAVASDVRQIPKLKLRAGLKVATAPVGAWSGTLTTPDTHAGLRIEVPANRRAQELLKVWTHHARNNGMVPGGFISRLGEHVKVFVKVNAADASGARFAKKMEPLLPRLDGSRDWQLAEASALLNDIAAVSDGVLSVMLEEIAAGKVQHGLLWEKALESAPWGQPLPNGLRTATIVGPGVTPRLRYIDWIGNLITQGDADKAGLPASGREIPLGTALGCRIFIHNSGKEPVVFRTRIWHHIEPTAKDGKGAAIAMESQDRFTRPPLVTFRLEPGRFIELPSPGYGLGKYGFHDFKHADITTWIGANEGDELTLTPGPLPLGDWNEPETIDGEPRWWLDFINARLNVMSPMPTDPADRRKLLEYAMRDLFLQNVQPTEEEVAAFLADTSPEALTKLAERLFHRPGVHAWSGPLQSGVAKFRVTSAGGGDTTPTEKPAATPPPADAPAADKPTTGA